MNQIHELENEELARCYTQLTNSVSIIYEKNGFNPTHISVMLEKMANQIYMIRSSRMKAKH